MNQNDFLSAKYVSVEKNNCFYICIPDSVNQDTKEIQYRMRPIWTDADFVVSPDIMITLKYTLNKVKPYSEQYNEIISKTLKVFDNKTGKLLEEGNIKNFNPVEIAKYRISSET